MSDKRLVIEIPGVHAENGLALCDGDMTIYLNSLRLCVNHMPAALEKMRRVSAETLHDYAINVHSAKSISAYIGAEETRNTAKQLEDMAKKGDLPGVLGQNETFLKNAGKLVEDIRNWLKNNNLLNG